MHGVAQPFATFDLIDCIGPTLRALSPGLTGWRCLRIPINRHDRTAQQPIAGKRKCIDLEFDALAGGNEADIAIFEHRLDLDAIIVWDHRKQLLCWCHDRADIGDMHLLHVPLIGARNVCNSARACGLGERFFGRVHPISGLAEFAHRVVADFGFGRDELLSQTGDRGIKRDDLRARNVKFGSRFNKQLLALQFGQN